MIALLPPCIYSNFKKKATDSYPEQINVHPDIKYSQTNHIHLNFFYIKNYKIKQNKT